MFPKINPTTTPSWKLLQEHYSNIENNTIQHLFELDSERFNKYALCVGDILFDFSKNLITERTVELLIDLSEDCFVKDAIQEMFNGSKINQTENRAVLHTALRDFTSQSIKVEDIDILHQIKAVLNKMNSFCKRVHEGEWKGYSGKNIKNIVNIGIGGSDLGPVMVTEALQPYKLENIQAYFVSNVDASHILEVLHKISAEETLFIIASKTFTTQETMANANTAKEWFLNNGGNAKDISSHFVAISTNQKAVNDFGIAIENMFEFWDWVGGRYSLWSSIGLSVALTIGYDKFEEMLRGAHSIDLHFKNAPIHENIPIMMALVGIWNRNFLNIPTEAILPYDQYLHRFPAYLQQANMESNGKSIDRNEQEINYQTGPIIWGEPGTNGQHAFYQLIHQGTQKVACDFIATAQSHHSTGNHQTLLISNFFAQTEALMKGNTHTNPYRVFEGNRPSNSILIKKLTPYSLGQLIALYEHKIFVQGIIWNIFSFDQWGVELGKVLANNILLELSNDDSIHSHDSSTNGLINAYKKMRN